ncbi:MAG: hypothetical protein AAGH17_00630 [Pseudomonadota bacterium]
MFGIGRTVILVVVAFVAGMLFERSNAGALCQGASDWNGYLQCVLSEML